jgi:hypothetical protein
MRTAFVSFVHWFSHCFLSADDLSGVDSDKCRHAELMLQAWFEGGKVPEGQFGKLKKSAIDNYQDRISTLPVTTAPGGPDLHDCNLLNVFCFDLLPGGEFAVNTSLLALVLNLVRQFKDLFLRAC